MAKRVYRRCQMRDAELVFRWGIGETATVIAAAAGMSRAAVYRRAIKTLGLPRRNPKKATKAKGERVPVGPSPEMIAQARAMFDAGKGDIEISRACGRARGWGYNLARKEGWTRSPAEPMVTLRCPECRGHFVAVPGASHICGALQGVVN